MIARDLSASISGLCERGDLPPALVITTGQHRGRQCFWDEMKKGFAVENSGGFFLAGIVRGMDWKPIVDE